MSKLENYELRKYAIDYIVSQLENCELFMKVFGKEFARRNAVNNISTVNIVKDDNSILGYYDLEFEAIFLNNKSNKKDITFEEIKQNKELLFTLLHEGIHAILKRTKEECEKSGIEYGTGIEEIYKQENNHLKNGRKALNEGLTNWIAEKTGAVQQVKDLYEPYKTILQIIEIANGEENVMGLGKGNIDHNVTKRLAMSERGEMIFEALLDEHLATKRSNDDINQLRMYWIKSKQYKDNDNVELTKTKMETQELLNDNKYLKHLTTIEYFKYIEKFNLDDTFEQFIIFLNTVKKANDMRANRLMAKAFDMTYIIYFKQEIEDILKMEKVSKEAMGKMTRLHELYRRYRGEEEIEFDSKYELIAKRYESQVFEEVKRYKNEGILTAEKLDSLVGFGPVKYNEPYNHILGRIAGIIDSRNIYKVSSLLSFLASIGKLKLANNCSILIGQPRYGELEAYKMGEEIIGIKENDDVYYDMKSSDNADKINKLIDKLNRDINQEEITLNLAEERSGLPSILSNGIFNSLKTRILQFFSRKNEKRETQYIEPMTIRQNKFKNGIRKTAQYEESGIESIIYRNKSIKHSMEAEEENQYFDKS